MASTTILSDNGVSSGSAGIKTTGGNDGVLILQTTTSGGTATNAVYIDANQNVGLGTTPIASNMRFSSIANSSVNTAIGTRAYGLSCSINSSAVGGTLASPSASTTSTAPLNLVGSCSYDGTNFFNSHSLVFGLEATPTISSAPSYVAISTTSSGSTSRTERLRVNSTGTVTLQGGNTSSNGIGISFPATQSASTDANTLDDYEEGIWTPNLESTGTAPTVSSYTNRTGSYTKVGNLVTASCFIRATISSIGTGYPVVTGLPFAAAGFLDGVSVGIVDIANNTSTSLGLWYVGGTYVYAASGMAYNTGSNRYFTFTVSYRVA